MQTALTTTAKQHKQIPEIHAPVGDPVQKKMSPPASLKNHTPQCWGHSATGTTKCKQPQNVIAVLLLLLLFALFFAVSNSGVACGNTRRHESLPG
jgi:hypothetical protein